MLIVSITLGLLAALFAVSGVTEAFISRMLMDKDPVIIKKK